MAKRRRNEEIEEQSYSPIITKSSLRPIKFTHSQLNFLKSIDKNIITTCTGPAGTAKTFVSCFYALDQYIKGNCKKIVLVKPAVESGDSLGFLPGTLQEKIAPFMASYISNMEKIIGKETLGILINRGVIEMKSLSHERGVTEDDSIMILDEAQNSDLRQIILFVTRMGKDSKVVLCGDVTQWDEKKRRKDFLIFNDIMEDVPGVGMFAFDKSDIVRHKILIDITDKYEKYKADNNID